MGPFEDSASSPSCPSTPCSAPPWPEVCASTAPAKESLLSIAYRRFDAGELYWAWRVVQYPDLPSLAEEEDIVLNTVAPKSGGQSGQLPSSQCWADWMDEDEEEESDALEAFRLGMLEEFARKSRQTLEEEPVAGGSENGSTSDVDASASSAFDAVPFEWQPEASASTADDADPTEDQPGHSEPSAFDAVPLGWQIVKASSSSATDAAPVDDRQADLPEASQEPVVPPSTTGFTLSYGDVLRRAAKRFARSGTGLCRPPSAQKGSHPSKLPRPSGRSLAQPSLSLPPLTKPPAAQQELEKTRVARAPPELLARSKKAPTVARGPKLATAKRAVDRQARRKA
ncbi:MAG: hypothetical protein M1832_006449 [Thelocarpon impressellum]|nr:MAG: hypothetical protein M1832_006449 [Thelocarpon impressellum]